MVVVLRRVAVGGVLQEDLALPTYAYEFDSGADLLAAESVLICPTDTKVISSGLAVSSITPGFEIQLRSRSGLSTKGIIVANAPATIDNGYTGEIKIILHNQGRHFYQVNRGDKIAQMVVARYNQAHFVLGAATASDRGESSLGSTGV